MVTKQGEILANPAADLELPRMERRLPRTILSVEQVEEIVSLCDVSTLQGVRDRALQAVHASTHPAEADNHTRSGHNDTTTDTTRESRNEHNPLQDR